MDDAKPRVLRVGDKSARPGAVYVGRPSKWGNPFVIRRDGTRDEVVAKYEEWFRKASHLWKDAVRELGGKDLLCHCAPEKCHAEVLLHFANNDGFKRVVGG